MTDVPVLCGDEDPEAHAGEPVDDGWDLGEGEKTDDSVDPGSGPGESEG